MTKVLFICNQNKHRSKTAEDIFKNRFETKSAGLFCPKPLTEKELSWAEVVMVMEEAQREEISKRFPKLYLQKRVLNLGIPDKYNYGNSELTKILNQKIEEYSDLF
ncbi:MAG: phosphotyrosine protein phosphatase [Nanoarchaeota archaeon]